MRHVRQAIDSGAIGTPSWARIRFRTGFDVYATQPYFLTTRNASPSPMSASTCWTSRAFFMGEVVRISCETQQRNPTLRGEDAATMLLRHERGGVSVVECTYEARRSPDPFPETLVEIEGPRGSIIVDTGCRMTLTSDGQPGETDIGAPLLSWTSHPWHVSQQGALGACRHFLDCLQRGVAAETSGADNLKSYALVDAAYRAAVEHGAIVPTIWEAGGANIPLKSRRAR